MADFATALAVLGNALNVVKGLNEIDREFDKAKLKMEVADLATALAKAQITLAEAQREAADKDAEIRRLQTAFRAREELVEHQGYHFRKRSDGKPQGPPHCPRCLQKGGLFMMTTKMSPGRPYQCPECKAEYLNPPAFFFESEG